MVVMFNSPDFEHWSSRIQQAEAKPAEPAAKRQTSEDKVPRYVRISSYSFLAVYPYADASIQISLGIMQ